MPHPWGLPQSREPPVLPSSSWSIPLVFQAQSELSVRMQIGLNQVDTRNSLEGQGLVRTAEQRQAKAGWTNSDQCSSVNGQLTH